MKYDKSEIERHLCVYEDRSVYYSKNGNKESFQEGSISNEAKKRIKNIRDAFESGFLEKLIISLGRGKESIDKIKVSETASDCVNILVNSLTSEVGRALIGLSVMQLCIKAIEPKQNIRLHKGSVNRASFSWVEGVSMRTLDKKHVTPTLRKHNLLRLNVDGFMMTRSLAENYPYTTLYKANLKGAREQWLVLVEEIEKNKTSPIETLKLLLARLINEASNFDNAADELMELANIVAKKQPDRHSVISLMNKHSNESEYAARLLEINMHALMYSAVGTGAYGSADVKPLSQMRSANKKHGNIGDIELLDDDQIIEAWDAKYGKSYLREEIEEATEKLQSHDYVNTIGFVTNVEIERTEEITKRIAEIEQLYSVTLKVVSFNEWVDMIYNITLESGCASEAELSQKWLITYCEYLSQRKRKIAPIDEPCFEWVTSFTKIINNA